jgi:hypothetical protein
MDDATKPGKPHYITPTTDLEDELPSLSTFIPKKPIRTVKIRLPEAVNDIATKQGRVLLPATFST